MPRKQREIRAPRPWKAEGERLRAYRLAILPEIDWKTYAEGAGIAHHSYRQCENGMHRMSIENALELRARYKVSLDFLYAGDDSTLPNNVLKRLVATRR